MDCREVTQRIHELADGELPQEDRVRLEEHVSACSSCGRIYEGIRGLKKLVRASAGRVAVPSGLEQNVRRRLEAAEPRRGRRQWLAAAAVLIAGLLAGVYFAFLREPPLAHAQVLRGCLDEFRKLLDREWARRGGTESLEDCVRRDLAVLDSKIGSWLDRLPIVEGTDYCGASRYVCPLSGARGVRFDFVASGEPESSKHVSVFVLPLAELPSRAALVEEIGPEGHHCSCSGANDTIYCRLTPKCFVSFVSSIDKPTLFESYRPTLAAQ